MSDGVLDAYDDEASAWTDAHTTLDHNGDEDDDGDAWVDEDESVAATRAAIPRPHDAVRSAKQAAKTLAQRMSSQAEPSKDPKPLAARLAEASQHSQSVPDPVEPAAVDRWAGRAPPPHLAKATGRWGPNVTRRVKTIDDIEATELVGDEDHIQQQAEEVKGDDRTHHQGGDALVEGFDAIADESAWDAPTGGTYGLQPALTPRKVNFHQAQSEDNAPQEEHHETLDDTQEERPNDWGEPPYEVLEAPDNGSVLRLGDHWLEVEPPMGCRSWEIFFRRNPTFESLDRPEDEDEYYWYDDYYDDYAEYPQEGSSHPVQHPDASPILFVGGLPYSLTVGELREAFTAYGNILRVAIPKDPETGKSRGFGYVEFDSQDPAHSAMEALAGQELGGRTMRLDYALPRGHASGDGGYTNDDGGRTGGYQSQEYASESPAPWQPPPVNKSVTCTNTVALPFNRWGRKATESGGADEQDTGSQERPQDAMVNTWLQKQPLDSVDNDGWGPTENVPASDNDGWGPNDNAQATSNDDGWGPTDSAQPTGGDDGWGPTEVVQTINDDSWGASEDVEASNDDGWGPTEEAATPKATVQSLRDTNPTSAPTQPAPNVSPDSEEDAVEIPSTLKIDWPADTSGGWDDPVDSVPAPQARAYVEPLQAAQPTQPIQTTTPMQPVRPMQPGQPIQPSSPAEELVTQTFTHLKGNDEAKLESTVEDEESNKAADKDDQKDDKCDDKNDYEAGALNEDRSETPIEDKNAVVKSASLPQRPQWTSTDSKSSRSTGLNQGIRAPTVPPSGDQILLKNFKSRGGPPAASLPIPRVVKAFATRSSEPSTPTTPTEIAADPAAELQKLLDRTEAALQGFDAAKKTDQVVPVSTGRAADSGIMLPVKKISEPIDLQEKMIAPPVVEKVAPIEATLAAATPADNRIEALVQQLKAQRERLRAILDG